MILAKIGFAAVALSLMAGCSSPGPAPAPKKTPVPVKTLRAFSPTITVNSADGKKSFIVRLKDTDIHLKESGEPDYGKFTSAKGEILEGKVIVCRFEGDSGHLDRDNRTLDLSGNVKIKSESDGVEINALNVQYFQDKNMIEATGNVTVVSESMTMGPFNKVLSTADLKKIATPGKFR